MTSTPVARDLAAEVDRVVGEHVGELVALRRQLHAHPEVSSNEVQTTRTVAERLRIAGLTPALLARGTGLVCDVVGDSPVPLVALRADIDALAMDDHTTTDYRSQVPGVAHACGHDAHTAIVLGAGIVLARLLPGSGISGSVRLVFEPAEETVPGGAVDVIAEGWFEGVSSVYGLHCDPKLDSGRIGLRAGAITSATDKVTLELQGPGGHTARPHLTVDLVREAARVALELPGALARIAGEHGRANLVWGSLRSGDAPNVIPSRALLTGTLRTPDHRVWDNAPRLVERAVAEVMQGSAATWDLTHLRGVPPVVNDERPTELMTSVVRAVLGDDGAVTTDQSLGGDSFAWYLQEVPGTYARLGVRDPDAGGPGFDLHASTFDVDERAIAHGVRVLVLSALAALDEAR
ncbi:MAG: amidohydrolase [Candidatus Nanopelagicales bacterium]